MQESRRELASIIHRLPSISMEKKRRELKLEEIQTSEYMLGNKMVKKIAPTVSKTVADPIRNLEVKEKLKDQIDALNKVITTLIQAIAETDRGFIAYEIYSEKKSVYEIATEYSVSHATVKNWVVKAADMILDLISLVSIRNDIKVGTEPVEQDIRLTKAMKTGIEIELHHTIRDHCQEEADKRRSLYTPAERRFLETIHSGTRVAAAQDYDISLRTVSTIMAEIASHTLTDKHRKMISKLQNVRQSERNGC